MERLRSKPRAPRAASPLRFTRAVALLLAAAALASSTAVAGEPYRERVAARPTEGASYDYPWDGSVSGHPERSWTGRAWVHPSIAADAEQPRPLVVFLHGLNAERMPHRWLGDGNEGDVRRIVQDLIDQGAIVPALVAGPGSVDRSVVENVFSLWGGFDLDAFLDTTREALRGRATIDARRVIVVGHSGAGCTDKGGIVSVLRAKVPPLAVISIDTCMSPVVALALRKAPPETSIIVTWQEQSWTDRPFDDFKSVWAQPSGTATKRPHAVLDRLHVREAWSHDATVHLTLEKWLPRLLSPRDGEPAPAR